VHRRDGTERSVVSIDVPSPEQPYGDLVPTTLRAVTWNVWGRFGPWRAREAALVAVLQDAAPDILFLQESWVDDAGLDQASVFGDRLGLQHHCRSDIDLVHDDWSPVNAILARWPLVDVSVHELPSIDDGWGGVVVRAVVDGPRGQLDTYCVALDWPPQASRRRQRSVAQLAQLIHDEQAAARRPLLVAGDFNADPHSDEIRALTGRREPPVDGVVLFDGWEAGSEGSGVTWSRSNPWAAPTLLPDRRIDYIFTGWPRRGGVGSVVSAELIGTEPVDGTIASDHYGVLAVVRY
jgi:endonuclease/exonuclease/phosphatase family metal-dependent hydrolase